MGLLPNVDDGGLGFNDDSSMQEHDRLSHPIAAAFHVGFRLFALLAYLFCGWFSSSFVISFVIIVLLLSADFWTVKNVTGRLLVGLRWWNYIDQDGKSHWVFEARTGEERNLVNAADSRIFWLALFLFPVLWFVFFVVTIFGLNFKWFMVVCIGIALNGANLYGYLRCRIGQREKLSTVASNFIQQQVVKNVVGSFGRQQPESQQRTMSTI